MREKRKAGDKEESSSKQTKERNEETIETMDMKKSRKGKN